MSDETESVSRFEEMYATQAESDARRLEAAKRFLESVQGVEGYFGSLTDMGTPVIPEALPEGGAGLGLLEMGGESPLTDMVYDPASGRMVPSTESAIDGTVT